MNHNSYIHTCVNMGHVPMPHGHMTHGHMTHVHMRRLRVIVVWLALSLAAVACQQGPDTLPAATEVVIPPPPTEALNEPTAGSTIIPAVTEAAATATTVTEATEAITASSPSSTAEASPTEEASVTAEATPTTAESPTPEPSPTPAILMLAPGQSNAAPLSGGGFNSYGYEGLAFQPAVLFVEPADTLDVALAAYAGDVVAGSDLTGLEVLSEANFSTAGGPEILVVTPEEDGRYALLVQSVAGEGGYTAYLYDAANEAPGAAVRQADSLVNGETKTYTVQSNGARPVLVFVDPTDDSNVVARVADSNGNVAANANFSGPGSAEAVFVLPLQTTTYTVQVSEATGAPSAYNILIVTLE